MPVRIFISYAEVDQQFVDELVAHLAGMQRRNLVECWHCGLLRPGTLVDPATQDQLRRSSMVLMLVSPDYVQDHWREISDLAKRLADGVRVIPILIRRCNVESVPLLQSLHCLPAGYPANRGAVAERSAPRPRFITEWPSRDEAWARVVELLHRVIAGSVAPSGGPASAPAGSVASATSHAGFLGDVGTGDRPTLVSGPAPARASTHGRVWLAAAALFFVLSFGCLAGAWLLWAGHDKEAPAAPLRDRAEVRASLPASPSTPKDGIAAASSQSAPRAEEDGSCSAPCVAGAECRVDASNVGDPFGLCRAGADNCRACPSERACVPGIRGGSASPSRMFRMVASMYASPGYDEACVRLHGSRSFTCLRRGSEDSILVSAAQLSVAPGLDVELRSAGVAVARVDGAAKGSIGLYALCIGLRYKVSHYEVLFHLRDP
ncbi:MAG: TIR domain-containing protein [Polyangiaceae bacterium]